MLEDFLLLLGLLGLVGSIGLRWVLRRQPSVPPVEPVDTGGEWRDDAVRASPSSGRSMRRRRCR